MDHFDDLAAELGLVVERGRSPDGLEEAYLFSPDERYRYAFARWWGEPTLHHAWLWVMLNPARNKPGHRPRPTLRRIITRSADGGAHGVVTANLFALCAPKPAGLRQVDDPVGTANDQVLQRLTAAATTTVAAWGAHGSLRGRSTEVQPLLHGARCLGTTGKGQPRHPLYVPGEVELEPWP